jgi:hypothetical protein
VTSEESRVSEVNGDLLQGDLCTEKIGYEIQLKNKTTLRIGFQNIGSFS